MDYNGCSQAPSTCGKSSRGVTHGLEQRGIIPEPRPLAIAGGHCFRPRISEAVTSGCAEDPGGVPTCSLGSILAGGSAQYSITVSVDVAATGIITNQATVVSDTDDPDNSNDAMTEKTALGYVVTITTMGR